MSDMEGVSGIVVWDQVDGGAAMFEEVDCSTLKR